MIGRRSLLSAAALPILRAPECAQPGPHPDAALLALCARLAAMQAEWQRLYDVTSEEPVLTTPADHAWHAYSNDVWPHLSPWAATDDLPARLATMAATTPEGFQAKATAILALDAAASYCDLRDDQYDLTTSLLRDVAGSARRPLGADATPLRPSSTEPAAICAGQVPGGAETVRL